MPLKSDLGLNGSPSFSDPTSSDYSQNGSHSAPQESEPWQGPGNRYGHYNRAQTAVQTEKKKLVAAVMLDELIEVIKPWLYSLIGLYIFGNMVKLWLNYFRWKPLALANVLQRAEDATDSRTAPVIIAVSDLRD